MRMEHDLLGDKAIPDDVYYGVQTARALVREKKFLSEEQISSVLDPRLMTGTDGR